MTATTPKTQPQPTPWFRKIVAGGSLISIVAAESLGAGSPFLDAMFGCSTSSNVVYGTGNLGYPTTTNTMDLLLDVYQPTGAGLPAKLPGMIAIHGGGFTGGTKSDAQIATFCQGYAKRGYVVASINYRLQGDNPSAEPGPFPNTNALGRAMNAAAQDAAKAVRWLRANAASYNLDPARIAIQGGSAGAITALFEGCQETGTIGTNAQVGAIVDFWGGMYGAEYLVDADDPPVFIVHGTADPTVPITHSYNLTNQCGAVGLPYEFYPIQGAGHGCWGNFWNDVVNGKTIDRHCADFLFNHLELLSLHPVAATNVKSCSLNQGTGTMRLTFNSDSNFVYQVEASTELQTWSTNGMPAAVTGNGDTLILEPATTPTLKQFFRVNVKTNF